VIPMIHDMLEALDLMKKLPGEVAVYVDKRERPRTYSIITDGNGQNPHAEISHDVFNQLRQECIIGTSVMHWAWESEKGVHLFIKEAAK
jgi:hypothetical protein